MESYHRVQIQPTMLCLQSWSNASEQCVQEKEATAVVSVDKLGVLGFNQLLMRLMLDTADCSKEHPANKQMSLPT